MLPENAHKHIVIVQRIYLFLIIILLLSILATLLESMNNPEAWEVVIQIIIYSVIYWGLRNRKSWVVPLIIIASVLSLILTFIGLVSPAENFQDLLGKIYSVAFISFLIYQLWLFQKREVKSLFGYIGLPVF